MESFQTFLYLSPRRKFSFTTPPHPHIHQASDRHTYQTPDVNKANSNNRFSSYSRWGWWGGNMDSFEFPSG